MTQYNVCKCGAIYAIDSLQYQGSFIFFRVCQIKANSPKGTGNAVQGKIALC